MSDDRSRYGPLVATASAAILAVSVFLPWYGLNLTASGAAVFQQQTQALATQFGNATLQNEVGHLNANVGALAGHQIATLTARQALTDMSIVLLLLAGAAFLLGLLRLGGSPAPALAGNEPIAGIGILATLCVLFRIGVPPSAFTGEGYFSLSPQYGAWLALVCAVGILLGGIWPRRIARRGAKPAKQGENVWSELSGWTPEG